MCSATDGKPRCNYCLQLAVCAVTERLLATLLAAAEEYPLAGVCSVFDRNNARVFVAPIAERLLTALATGAPKVGSAFFDLDGERRFLSYYGCCHCCNPCWLNCVRIKIGRAPLSTTHSSQNTETAEHGSASSASSAATQSGCHYNKIQPSDLTIGVTAALARCTPLPKSRLKQCGGGQ
mgnify:CR=1 FL=1